MVAPLVSYTGQLHSPLESSTIDCWCFGRVTSHITGAIAAVIEYDFDVMSVNSLRAVLLGIRSVAVRPLAEATADVAVVIDWTAIWCTTALVQIIAEPSGSAPAAPRSADFALP